MNAFCVGNFAHSVLPDTAARTVIQTLRAVFHTDKFVPGQAAVIAAAAGNQKFFQQPVTGGFVEIRVVKEFAAEAVPELFGFAQLHLNWSSTIRRIVKRIGAAQDAVVEAEVVERHTHFQFRRLEGLRC